MGRSATSTDAPAESRGRKDAPARSRGQEDAPVKTRGQRLLWSPVALLLVLLMAAGSVLMWIGLPLGLIWIASALSDSSQPSMGPYVLILVGLPIGAIVIGKALGALDRMHGRVTGRSGGEQRRNTWMNSMNEDSGTNRRQRSVLDTVMIVSVLSALVLGGIWFLAFAGSPLPT